MKKTLEYEYLVSFSHNGGFGTAYIRRNHKIDSTEQALNVQRFIEEENDMERVAIINFILLREVLE